MNVTIDEQPVALADGVALGEAFAQVQMQLGRQDRMIRSISLNGQVVDDDWEATLAELAPAEVGELALSTVSVDQMLRETVEEMVQALPGLMKDLEAVALHLQRGEDGAGFAQLSPSLETLQSYTQFLAILMQRDPDHLAAAEQQMANMTYWLQEIMAAWQREDYVLIADYLLYELMPALQTGRKWLRHIALDRENRP